MIDLPIALVNATPTALKQVQLHITAASGITVGALAPFDLAAGERARQVAEIHVGATCGDGDFTVSAVAGGYSDRVQRTLSVRPAGFPMQISAGGMLDAGGAARHIVRIPNSLVPGSLGAGVALYPTPVGNLTEALKSLMQEPNGCFEQTSSTTYPLVMADQYFTTHSGVDPALVAQSNDLLEKGYQRLIGFQCQNKGYEWFGEDPGHECLTAYGLLEFTDMCAVRPVDATMLANTRVWLLGRRDGKGGYTHERRSLHMWITDPGCANGYCTWALLECGQTGLDKEVHWLSERAASDSNSYVKALAANCLFLSGDHDGARKFMDELAADQTSDGHVGGATTSVVGSEGDSLDIEATSLATLAWLRDPAYAGNVEKSIHYLADVCQGGRYGSTQSTVLALRAIVGYDKLRAHPTAPGAVQLFADGAPAGGAMAFDATTTGALKLSDISSKLTPGDHTLELRMTDGSQLPYAIAITFNSLVPASSNHCKVAITTTLKDRTVTEGHATEAEVTVANLSDAIVPSPIAIIGLPGGLEVRYDQLKELVKSGRIAAYEVRGRELILYWRDMQAKETVSLPVSLTAAVPGQYTGPASRAYLYYADEFKQWQPGMQVTISPAGAANR